MSYMLEALSGSVQASALDLSQNGIATLEFQDQHRRLYHVTTLLVGRLGDLWEWTVLNHQLNLPSIYPRFTLDLPSIYPRFTLDTLLPTASIVARFELTQTSPSFADPLLGNLVLGSIRCRKRLVLGSL